VTDFAQYIGIPWQAGAQGPESYDCWAFFRHIQAEHFGIETPVVIAPDIDDHRALVDLFARHSERGRWLRTGTTTHGCAVLIHWPLHIGVWLNVDDGGVLHCLRGAGVVFTKDSAWASSGLGRKEYFTTAAKA
jgi:hypothetical protein